MAGVKAVRAPSGLRGAGAALWRDIAKQWADDGLVPDAREVKLLTYACREADTLALLEAELDTAASTPGGLVVKGSTGQPVTHPHIAAIRHSRAQIAAFLMKLGFTDPGADAARTSGIGSGPMSVAQAGRRGGYAKHYGSAYGPSGGHRG